MRIIYILALFVMISSCGNETELEEKIEQLQFKNDSLTSIVNDYQSKYVYERVFVKHYKTNSEPNRIGSLYKGEFVFVPDVRNDKIEFKTESHKNSIGNTESNSIILETKSGDFGAYPFEFKIMSDTTKLYFKPIIKDSLSMSNQNAGYDGTTISDIIIVN